MSWEKHTSFTSSLVKVLRYNPKSSTLEILFQNGKKFQYIDVPKEEWEDFKAADSKGRFFRNNINGTYIYGRV
ncbi:MAG: KTSC domain-containing protein [Deltaproteobacteria bacterium]|jgi:hypothetical protein|nr:KTSC domain-containing protein [Deltaproteobacteria bacterium]